MCRSTRAMSNVDDTVVANPPALRSDTSLSEETSCSATDKFTKDLIQRKSRQLINKCGFTRSDRDDIQQELWLRVLKAERSFDPNHAHWNAFITAAIERHAANILRDKRSGKRDYRRAVSLNVLVAGEDGQVELGKTIGSREYDARRVSWPRERHDREQLKQDVNDFIPKLSPEDQTLCGVLKEHSPSEAARRMDVPCSTFHRKVQQLRQPFERAGFRDYIR